MTAEEAARRRRESTRQRLSTPPAIGEPLKWWQKAPGPVHKPRNPAEYVEMLKALERDLARLPVLADEWAELDKEWHEIYLNPGYSRRVGACVWGKRFLVAEAERLQNSIRYAQHHLERYSVLLAVSVSG